MKRPPCRPCRRPHRRHRRSPPRCCCCRIHRRCCCCRRCRHRRRPERGEPRPARQDARNRNQITGGINPRRLMLPTTGGDGTLEARRDRRASPTTRIVVMAGWVVCVAVRGLGGLPFDRPTALKMSAQRHRLAVFVERENGRSVTTAPERKTQQYLRGWSWLISTVAPQPNRPPSPPKERKKEVHSMRDLIARPPPRESKNDRPQRPEKPANHRNRPRQAKPCVVHQALNTPHKRN